MIIRRIFLLILILLFGCAGPQMDISNTEIRRAASKIKIIESGDEVPSNHQIIGEVQGVSCGGQNNTAQTPASKDEAYRELKLQAARINADAVINVFCEDTGVDWKRNCWTTIACVGDGIKINE